VRFAPDACVTVVLASEGYPAAPRTGDAILGLDAAAARPGVVVFHAGTTQDPTGAIVTGGGRVLDVTALGPTVGEARRRAYAAAAEITWPGMQYRHDIAAAA
jgi:phosphoribosylamine--glycine ligase